MINQFFGWKPPTPEKLESNLRYPFRKLGLKVPTSVEVTLPLPSYIKQYDQGTTAGCTGFSASWMMSIYNKSLYDALWLYRRGQSIDNDPSTNSDNDGGYIWAVMDVLRKEGHREVINGKTLPVELLNGIKSYYWIQTIDDIRTSFSEGRSVVLGIYWYSEFQNPRTINGEFWIGSRKNWGNILGGHAICGYACSDSRQAIKLVNSWGSAYPNVWISYSSIEKLLARNGECTVAFDIENDVPIEPPDDDVELPDEIEISFDILSQRYSGKVLKQF